MRTFLRKCLPASYSTVMALANGVGVSSLLSSNSAQLTRPIAYSLGAIKMIGTWLTSFLFEGSVIQTNLSHYQAVDSPDYIDPDKVSRARKTAYIITKYGLVVFCSITDNISNLFLQYLGTKAWIQVLKGDPEPDSIDISLLEAGCLSLYFFAFVLPFLLSNELEQTCEQLRRKLKIPMSATPDNYFIAQTQQFVLKPLVSNNGFRKFVRGVGSVEYTCEKMLSLITSIPAAEVAKLYAQQPIILIIASIPSAALLGMTFSSIATQTYLFEGSYSEKNMKAVALLFDGKPEEEESPWLHPSVAKLFDKLLYLDVLVVSINTALTLSLFLEEINAPLWSQIISFIIAGTIVGSATYYSKLKDGQASLAEITKQDYSDNELPLSHCCNCLLFKPPKKKNLFSSYGSINETEDSHAMVLSLPKIR